MTPQTCTTFGLIAAPPGPMRSISAVSRSVVDPGGMETAVGVRGQPGRVPDPVVGRLARLLIDRTLGCQVSPPSRETRRRTFQPGAYRAGLPLGRPRRSYQDTATRRNPYTKPKRH